MERTLLVLASFVALGGCGGGGDTAPDANLTPPIDATPPDAHDPTVTLIAADGAGAPMAGAAVVFLDPDDGVIADTTLDADGRASAPMPDGGSVVLLTTDAGLLGGVPIGSAFAWLDVVPGATYTRGAAIPAATAVTVALPTIDNATQYVAASSCDFQTSAGGTVVLNLCGTHDDLFIGGRDAGNAPVGGLLMQAVPAQPDVDASMGSIDGNRDVTLTALDVPADVTGITMFSAERTDQIPWGLALQAVGSGPSQTLTVPDVGPGNGVLTFQATVARSAHPTQLTFGNRRLGSEASFYVASGLLPDLASPSWDAATGTISWTAEAGALADTVAELHVSRAGATLSWFAATPGDATTARLPHLPASHDAYNPLATDTPLGGPAVTAYRGDSASTDAHLRTSPFEVGMPMFGFPTPVEVHAERVGG